MAPPPVLEATSLTSLDLVLLRGLGLSQMMLILMIRMPKFHRIPVREGGAETEGRRRRDLRHDVSGPVSP
jgi:hypothetical protein